MSGDELVLGGYLSGSRAVREGWQSDLLPERFISVSSCLTGVGHGPELWAWHTDPGSAICREGTLLAIGFTRGDAAALVEEVRPDCSPRSGRASDGVPEGLTLLVAATGLPGGAQLRGFEVIGVEWALTSVHSWLCHSYEPEVGTALGIRPNRWGLLETYAQASSVLAWMLDLPVEQAPEPVYWTVAAIAECGPDALSLGSASASS